VTVASSQLEDVLAGHGRRGRVLATSRGTDLHPVHAFRPADQASSEDRTKSNGDLVQAALGPFQNRTISPLRTPRCEPAEYARDALSPDAVGLGATQAPSAGEYPVREAAS
jgi:hypothetical protein